MRFVPFALIALGILTAACASPAHAPAEPTAIESPPPPPSREQVLVEEARAAIGAMDLPTARTKAAEAIEILLARPEAGRDADWLMLVVAAAKAASEAQDDRTARAAWEAVVEVFSRTLPEDDPNLLSAQQYLAGTMKPFDLQGARALEEKVLAARLCTRPDDDPDLQTARQNLAITLCMMNDVPSARPLFEKVLEVRSGTLSEDHPELQAARGNLAIVKAMLGDRAGARSLQEQVLASVLRTRPEDHPDIQSARMNLAAMLKDLDELEAARALLEQVLEVYLRTLPDDHTALQNARSNLALTLLKLGDLPRAHAIQEEVIDVLSLTMPEEHPALQTARMELASTLKALGDLAGARVLQEKVLEVRSHTLPDEHPLLQASREALADTLQLLDEVEDARTLHEKVLEVRLATLPEDHLHVQMARGRVARAAFEQGELETARALDEAVIESLSHTLPESDPELQIARLNHAATLYALGELQAARALQQEMLEVFSRTLPEDEPRLRVARLNLATTILAIRAAGGERVDEGESEEFARLVGSFIRTITRSARLVALTATGRAAEEHCVHSIDELGRALSMAEGAGVFEDDPGLEREAFVLSEETRGVALAAAHHARLATPDARCDKWREEMRAASDELARLAQVGASADEFDRSRRRRERAEREILELARELWGTEPGLLEFDPSALSGSLSDKEAIVGYRRYRRWAQDPSRGILARSTPSLCAFVLRSGDRLERIDLGRIDKVEAAVSRLREALGVGSGRGVGVSAGARGNEDEIRAAGEVVRRAIFDPLLPALEGADHLVVALDDVLHLVPLDMLPIGTEAGPTLVGDRWRIELRSTLRELLWEEPPCSTSGTLVALGGASFDLAALPFSAEESGTVDEPRESPTGTPFLLRGSSWEAGFEPLGQTGPEVRGIADLYRASFGEGGDAFVLEQRKASRASLAELAPRARFLHIATHGWFAPESVRSTDGAGPLDAKTGWGARTGSEERVRSMSPMLLCGLALAGANLSEDELGRTPGLVTAEQLSTLDLSGCELAVLSACDTNAGERQAGQGVASLQKALQMAGARTVITSLWKVPDEATKELMLDLYRRIWIEGKPKSVALWEAKARLRDAQDESGKRRYSTRDWAAWVMTGDPR